ncbi:hypothetical protein E4T56_gene12709 [Termitomyces sp. T112]|nr:hypothetical protein E4T56_gene12709 [Termitomyces sp. T112]
MQGTQRGSSAEVTQATVERAQRREEWLANEAALGWWGVLHWAREHHILLDRASAALGVGAGGHADGASAGRTSADPGAWWEVAMDMAEPLPEHPKVLATVIAQLEVDLVGRIAEVDLEGEGE